MVSGAAAPEGTTSCRTQGDFHSFVCMLKLEFEPQGWDFSLRANDSDIIPFGAAAQKGQIDLNILYESLLSGIF